MKDYHLIITAKILAMFMAIFSVVLYAEVTFPWRIILWIPISVGYCFWFSDIIENWYDIKILKYKQRRIKFKESLK